MCHANEILITSDSNADALPDNMDAPQATQMGPTPVQNCMQSCCKTFVPKNSDKVTVDGVKNQ